MKPMQHQNSMEYILGSHRPYIPKQCFHLYLPRELTDLLGFILVDRASTFLFPFLTLEAIRGDNPTSFNM